MVEEKRKNSVRSSQYYSLILLRTHLRRYVEAESVVYPDDLLFPIQELTRLIEELEDGT